AGVAFVQPLALERVAQRLGHLGGRGAAGAGVGHAQGGRDRKRREDQVPLGQLAVQVEREGVVASGHRPYVGRVGLVRLRRALSGRGRGGIVRCDLLPAAGKRQPCEREEDGEEETHDGPHGQSPLPDDGLSYTTFPPTTVSSTFVLRTSSTGHFSTSRSTTIRSASLPTSRVPLSFSSWCR